MVFLSDQLKTAKGKKQYGYLKAPLKSVVDEIVDELAKDERVSSAYALWQDLREQLCTDYNQTPPQRVPLSQQKEFKTVRNMVIRETLRLSEMHFTFEDDAMQDEPEPEEPEPTVTPAAEEPEAASKTNVLPSLILLGAVAVGGIGFALTRLKRKKAARQVRPDPDGDYEMHGGYEFPEEDVEEDDV